MHNKNLNEITNCHSGHTTHVILNLIQDLIRDAECPQHDKRGSCECGRSMVEMLGVLAVMGLLTIIGIAGFKIAMNKAKANSLVADMNRLAHVVSMDKFSGYSTDAINRAVAEHNNDTEYPAECNSAFKSSMFSLETQNAIDKELCEQVAALGWKVPVGMFVNGIEKKNFAAEDCTDSNTLTWVFMDDLSACTDCVLGKVDCPPPEEMECGTCTDLKGFAVDHSQCADNANGNKCSRGKCEKCEEGQFWRNFANECFRCSNIGEGYYCASSNQADKCYGKGFYIGSHWQCGTAMMSCFAADESIGSADEAGCKACPNRCYANGDCNLYGADKANLRNADGSCSCNEAIGAFEAGGVCRWCGDNTYLNRSDPWRCEACGTSYQTYSVHAQKCLGSGFYVHHINDSSSNGTMISCSAEIIERENTTYGAWFGALDADEESCKACEDGSGTKNRCYNATTKSCVLTGDTKANLRNADGSCSCNTDIGAFMFNNQCRLCPENQFLNTYDGNCAPCGEWHFAVEAEKHKCLGIAFYTAYKDGKHYNGDGFIASCSDAGGWSTNYEADELSCKRCSQRCYLDGACYLANGSPYYRVSSSDENVDGTCTTTAPSQ